MKHEQTPAVIAHQSELSNIFSKFDAGLLSDDRLFEEIRQLGIEPTQTLEKRLRAQFGGITFVEFFQALQARDDSVITHMSQFYSKDMTTDDMNNEEMDESFGYMKSQKDLLSWQVHNPPNTGTESPSKSTDAENFPNLRAVFKAWVENRIPFYVMEKYVRDSGMDLNAEQEKLLARCRIDVSVLLSELCLAFRSPKAQRTGNFSRQEARNAQREPLQVVDHPIDVITWRRDYVAETADTVELFRPSVRSSKFSQHHQQRDWDIVTLSGTETEQKTPVKRQLKGTDKNPFESELAFENGHIVPKEGTASVSEQSGIKHFKNTFHHTNTNGLLSWQNGTESEAPVQTTRLDYTRYRHDDRVAFHVK